MQSLNGLPRATIASKRNDERFRLGLADAIWGEPPQVPLETGSSSYVETARPTLSYLQYSKSQFAAHVVDSAISELAAEATTRGTSLFAEQSDPASLEPVVSPPSIPGDGTAMRDALASLELDAELNDTYGLYHSFTNGYIYDGLYVPSGLLDVNLLQLDEVEPMVPAGLWKGKENENGLVKDELGTERWKKEPKLVVAGMKRKRGYEAVRERQVRQALGERDDDELGP
ncbi:hypothetical protein PENSPDRAFT_685313 [Peniophora sp. CONT]|nr:hypothetical protein PENSPDRAFT_685313 [Peniophora sp. CONT]